MKNDLIDRRIADLESELAKLRQKKVAQLREELSRLESDLNGTRPVKVTKGWAADIVAGGIPAVTSSAPRKARGRGKRLTEEEVVELLRREVEGAGSEGISARSAAQQAGINYIRAIKSMDANFTKTGSGKWTRYTI